MTGVSFCVSATSAKYIVCISNVYTLYIFCRVRLDNNQGRPATLELVIKESAITTNSSSQRWAEGAIVYQVYPRSFYDANGDGVGDLAGVTAKLDYLKQLGVNAIWLSPFYPSPMADFGYDVADYCDVDPLFGNLADFRELLAQAHDHDIKLMVDLVPNHTSDEHEWFKQSRLSKDNTYADWYIWRDAISTDGQGQPIPPNNWVGEFNGESAWEWVEARQQFYLHSFDVRQPDLNWDNPAVHEGIKKVMRFWLDMGVDGFRVDAVNFMAKDPQLRDDPVNPDFDPANQKAYDKLLHANSRNWPGVFDHLAEMAEVLKEPAYIGQPRFMVTEAYIPDADHVEGYMAYYQKMDPQVAAPFCFEGLTLPWQAEPWRQFLDRFHSTLHKFNPLSVPSYAFGNHDRPRLVSRLGEPAARSAAVMLLTLPGMAYIYNGDEIGMANGEIAPEFVQDPGAAGRNGRDPERTPLQWSAAKNAGFSTAETTWLPIAAGYETCNVETQSQDDSSFLSLYRQLGALRNTNATIRYGTIDSIDTGDPDVLGYIRGGGEESILVLINFADDSRAIDLAKLGAQIILSSDGQLEPGQDLPAELQANQAVICLMIASGV